MVARDTQRGPAAPTLELTEPDASGFSGDSVERWLWRLTALGVGLRLLVYALRPPIWTDEAKLAVSLLDRDFAGLLQPLAYSQIAPVLFMWLQKGVTMALGFSELSLRLVPLAAAIASVFLMRHLTRRVLTGAPAVFALAWFAVSYYPVRHAAELKPYATDLLASLVLTALAAEWLATGRARLLWILAAAAPLAVALSYPAIFTAAGVLAALALPARRGGRAGLFAWAAAAAASGSVFALNYLLVGAAHQQAREATRAVWPGGFPPLDDPLAAAGWLVTAHTGRTFGYPLGAENGGSALTFALFVGGAVALYRSRRRRLLAVLLLPFGAGLGAAVLQRYPYGGSGRVSQYMVPAICLLAGLGAAWLTARPRAAASRLRLRRAVLAALVGFGALLALAAVVHPYRDLPDLEARRFARRFWAQEAAGAALVVDAWEDLGLEFARPSGYWTPGGAGYRINQRIYRPRERRGRVTDLAAEAGDRPLRVVFLASVVEKRRAELDVWLREMAAGYALVGEEDHRLGGFAEQHGEGESVRVYAFEPRRPP